jgi:hypothetical protein
MRNATAIPSSAASSPRRTAHAVATGSERSRSRTTAMTRFATHSTAMEVPMTAQTAVSNGVATSKWLARPRMTCPTIAIISMIEVTATTVPAPETSRRARVPRTRLIIQASVEA